MELSKNQKEIIENNPVFVGSSDFNSHPNITIVDGVKVNDAGFIVVMNVQMKTCKDNLTKNPMCCLAIYNSKSGLGLKIFGSVEYKEAGEDFDKAKLQQKDSDFQPKGVFLIKPKFVIDIK